MLVLSDFLTALVRLRSFLQTESLSPATISAGTASLPSEDVCAAGSVLIVPLTVLFYSIQRFLVRGLSFGAIAGLSASSLTESPS